MDLDLTEKLLFLYCLTNPLTNLCGVYECPLKRISFDTGIHERVVLKTFERFKGKVHYLQGWVYVRNFAKYQMYKNDSTQKAVESEMASVPLKIKELILAIDKQFATDDEENGVLFPEEVVQKEQIQNVELLALLDSQVQTIFLYYCKHINANVRLTPNAREKIELRLKEFGTAELKKAIDKFSSDEWRMENNSDKGLQWFFKGEEQVAKWLQLKATKNGNSSINVS